MNLLLLAGTTEARDMAQALQGRAEILVTASLAGVTRHPLPLGVATRSGGFGGSDGFVKYIQSNSIDCIVDATHPFAARITQRTAVCARDLGLPYLLLQRPGWTPDPSDQWHMVAQEEEVAPLIPKGARVFLATGRQTLHRFANLHGRRLICRQIDPPDGPFPFDKGCFLVGRPPFSVADEVALFRELAIDWLVVKNAGGTASRTKLDAARQLGIPVVMLARPPVPQADKAETVAEALQWLEARL